MIGPDKRLQENLADYIFMDAAKRAEACIMHLEYIADWLDCMPLSIMQDISVGTSACDQPVSFNIALSELLIRLRQVHRKAAVALQQSQVAAFRTAALQEDGIRVLIS